MLILRTYAHIAPLYPFPSLVPIYLRDLPPYDTFAQLCPLRMQTRGHLIQKRPRISTYLSESFSAICWIFSETFWLSKYPFLARLIKKWPRVGHMRAKTGSPPRARASLHQSKRLQVELPHQQPATSKQRARGGWRGVADDCPLNRLWPSGYSCATPMPSHI